ncbi:hypothetical protein L207DRAFT_536614 [Hyaloscypha variabilis F]|uniref:Uncharacterized protein n=1 Tax=Hyaloscypha variabilis (strain UAMH 11265 / GT02V1 / F) TaxID=1149755 RepID=A0A2J6R107_HYAVF|nr:hypothetical protein L207DRAFT_536614 [Hyaloscypha variabilis F]
MVMSYISGNGSPRGWYAHEEIDFYDHRDDGKLNHTILTLGGNNSVPVNSTVTAEFDFKGGITNITTGPSQYQVSLSLDQSAAGFGRGNWQTSPGIDFSQIVMGIETTGNATWNWGPTVWSDVTMTANTPDPAWCTSNSNMIGGEGREYNFQTSVNGNSSTCIVEIVELDIPWTPYPY